MYCASVTARGLPQMRAAQGKAEARAQVVSPLRADNAKEEREIGRQAMSIIRCENCSKLIDSDDRPDTYYENLDMWLCDECYPYFEKDDVPEEAS